MMKKLTAITALAVFGIGQGHALPSDANQPIRLTADRATFSGQSGKTSYMGNVIITQGTLKIRADQLTVTLRDNRSIKNAAATGQPASFEQMISQQKGLAKGQAKKIDYNAITGIITLTGNAKLTQNGASFAGNTIRYSLKLGDVEANSGGGQRVELIFPPNPNTHYQPIRSDVSN